MCYYYFAALRVLAAQALGLENAEDLRRLVEAQQVDGGWELAWMVKYESRAVMTVMAVRGIANARERGLAMLS